MYSIKYAHGSVVCVDLDTFEVKLLYSCNTLIFFQTHSIVLQEEKSADKVNQTNEQEFAMI